MASLAVNPESERNFDLLADTARAGGPAAVFELLERWAREQKDYSLLFRARLMECRYRLGLPLMQTDAPPGEGRAAYEQACAEAAREAGGLYLASGDVAHAWPYYRAVGDSATVAAALETVDAGQNADRLIEIAFHEQVNPRKGFELVLEHYGMCRAITYFGAYPDPATRPAALRALVRALYDELSGRLREAIAEAEGRSPEGGVAQFIEGRDWLFEGMSYHTDPSHISSVIQLAIESTDADTLRMALEMADYGRRLSSMFQFRGESPFEDPYSDCGIYLRALLGRDVGAAIAHFRDKMTRAGAGGSSAAETQVLVQLLIRLGRYQDAAEVALEFAPCGETATQSPAVYELCEMAQEFERWSAKARQEGDLLAFAAALLAPRDT